LDAVHPDCPIIRHSDDLTRDQCKSELQARFDTELTQLFKFRTDFQNDLRRVKDDAYAIAEDKIAAHKREIQHALMREIQHAVDERLNDVSRDQTSQRSAQSMLTA
jgi:hypothetical protein